MTEQQPRRLSAVMFTDVVGYTAIMQEDEEAARGVRLRHREVVEAAIAAHGGELVQYFGDGSLSTFPSAVRAVSAGVEIQRALREDVPLRIGVHQGEIAFDEQGVHGDSVNVAARVMGLGTAGSVLVSDKVHDELKNQRGFSTTSLGQFELKNVKHPLLVHAVRHEGLDVPSREEVLAQSKGFGRISVGLAVGVIAFGVLSVTVASFVTSEPQAVVVDEQAVPLSMVLIRAGTYRIGRVGSGDFASPEHEIELDAFAIGRTEVSVREYAEFIEAESAPIPWTSMPDSDLPVTGVFWGEADRYCAWRYDGGKLPTEQQWEAAARPAGQRYPWGDEFRSGVAITASSNRTAPAPVGSLTSSPDSIADMVGNVWEWTDSQMRAYPGGQAPEGSEQYYVIRGGAFDTSDDIADASYRGYLAPTTTDRSDYARTGFRCAVPVRTPAVN